MTLGEQYTNSEDVMLILMRGWQGSGKSTYAKKIKSAFSHGVIYSTDEYWLRDGSYCFDEDKLEIAHKWNYERTRERAFAFPDDAIIIDNTNILLVHMQPYVDIAYESGHIVVQALPGDVELVLTLMASEKSEDRDFAEAMVRFHASRNLHNVPEEAVLGAARNFQVSALSIYAHSFV